MMLENAFLMEKNTKISVSVKVKEPFIGVPEFNGTGIHKPVYYFEIYLIFCKILTIYLFRG